MKTKVILSAIAALAMLMPGTAEARNNKRPADNGKPRSEYRMDYVRPNREMREMRKPGSPARRPALGMRIDHRPKHGRYVTINHERLWLANGVLYRIIRTTYGYDYIVIGYLR